MHSAYCKNSSMPTDTGKRNQFKRTLLVKSLELTHAFASSLGDHQNDLSLVGGDYNMRFTEVDEALRHNEQVDISWEISNNDPHGNRDFIFATGLLTKLERPDLLNFERAHTLVAAELLLPHTVPPVPRAGPPGALASSQGPGGPCVIAGPHAGRAGCRGRAPSRPARRCSGDREVHGTEEAGEQG